MKVKSKKIFKAVWIGIIVLVTLSTIIGLLSPLFRF